MHVWLALQILVRLRHNVNSLEVRFSASTNPVPLITRTRCDDLPEHRLREDGAASDISARSMPSTLHGLHLRSASPFEAAHDDTNTTGPRPPPSNIVVPQCTRVYNGRNLLSVAKNATTRRETPSDPSPPPLRWLTEVASSL